MRSSRRNPPQRCGGLIFCEGSNVLLRRGTLRIGGALLETAGYCAPCSRMEEALGPGGTNAVRGRSGMCARVIEGGEVRVGDAVKRVDECGGLAAEFADVQRFIYKA